MPLALAKGQRLRLCKEHAHLLRIGAWQDPKDPPLHEEFFLLVAFAHYGVAARSLSAGGVQLRAGGITRIGVEKRDTDMQADEVLDFLLLVGLQSFHTKSACMPLCRRKDSGGHSKCLEV